MAKKEISKKVVAIKLILIVVLGLILGISCLFSKQIEDALKIGDKTGNYVSSDVIESSDLVVHYINVGQGDCTLIELPDGTTMMIDAGTTSSAKHIINYVKRLDISTIDYFILTHSDSDHSGGAKNVFESFEIKNVYRPFQISIDKISCEPIANEDLGVYYTDIYESTCNYVDTKVYQNFVNATYTETYNENGHIYNADVYVTYDGLTIESTNIENSFKFEFFAPLKRSNSSTIESNTSKTIGYPTKFYGATTSESKNNASPVMLLEYKDKSFLFTGDANDEVELDVKASLSAAELARFNNIDVFQAGHHGSEGSNCQEFLNLITPNYVVVSVGEGNTYKHPHNAFLDRVNNMQHESVDYLLRTDKIGDIAFGVKNDGSFAYTANSAGEGSVVVYWWQIAVGTFIVLSIVIICVKITNNKKATAKRFVSTTRKVTSKVKKHKIYKRTD